MKIKCNLRFNVVFKLALAPLKFDLMKKSEIRENLKDLYPWFTAVIHNIFFNLRVGLFIEVLHILCFNVTVSF